MHWPHTFRRNSSRMDTAAKTTSLLLLFLLPLLSLSVAQNVTQSGTGILNVGAILNLQSLVGKIARTSILMATEDFYAVHKNYTTKLVLHIRDSNGDNIQAACQNDGAIIGSSRLNFKNFSGLFLLTGVASTSALLIALVMFL